MKKIFSIIIALVMTISLVSAQTVEKSKWYENTSVTLLGGGITTGQFVDVPTPFFWDGTSAIFNGARPFIGIEVAKYITPSVGFSVEGLGFVKTTTSDTFFDESVVLANGKLNIFNWLGGYKGQPRVFEIVGVAGLGWGHDYVNNNTQTWSSSPAESKYLVFGNNPYNSNTLHFTDKNYVVYNVGAELNFNIGEERALQLSIRPGVMWFNKYTSGHFQSLPTFKHDARANVQLGLTYKFGKSGHHNFRLCPYSRTEEEYNQLLVENDFLKNNPNVIEKEVVKTETKEVIVKEETKVLVGSTVISFPIGSCALSNVEKQKVGLFAESFKDDDTVIQIVGSADSATGTETRNFALAQNRANVVKNVLINDFGISADRITADTKIDVLPDKEVTRCVVITVK